eukprot:1371501-Pyramimonas_sp.AAC.1
MIPPCASAPPYRCPSERPYCIALFSFLRHYHPGHFRLSGELSRPAPSMPSLRDGGCAAGTPLLQRLRRRQKCFENCGGSTHVSQRGPQTMIPCTLCRAI